MLEVMADLPRSESSPVTLDQPASKFGKGNSISNQSQRQQQNLPNQIRLTSNKNGTQRHSPLHSQIKREFIYLVRMSP